MLEVPLAYHLKQNEAYSACAESTQEVKSAQHTRGTTTETTSEDVYLWWSLCTLYLDPVITDEGSKPEILSRIAQTTAALTGLKPVLD